MVFWEAPVLIGTSAAASFPAVKVFVKVLGQHYILPGYSTVFDTRNNTCNTRNKHLFFKGDWYFRILLSLLFI